jgi:hypothetical protein
MNTLLLAAWMSTSEAGTIYGIERSGANFNWFAYDVDTGTRSVLAPFPGDIDPSRPGDLAWNVATEEMSYIPGGPHYRDLYTVALRSGAVSWVDNYTPEINTIVNDTSGGYLYAFNLGGVGGMSYSFALGGTSFTPHLPYTNAGTRAAVMIGLALAILIDPVTGEVFEYNLNTGGERLVGNLTSTPGVIRGLAYDASVDQLLMVDHAGTLYELDPHRAYQASEIAYNLGDVWAMEVVPRSTFVSPTIVDYAACPGVDPVLIRDMTPGGSVAILLGAPGFSSVPAGNCAGTLLPISAPRLVGMMRANALGEISVSPTLPAGVCGKKLMAVDLTTCTITNTTTL